MTQITFQQMVRKLSKDGKNILASLTPEKCHVWHMASCIMGEVAELTEGQVTGDVSNTLEELGDIEFYMEGLRDGFGISRAHVIEQSLSVLPIDVPCSFYIDGLTVEAANIFDACKKWIFYEKEIDSATLTKALARFEWYMSAFRGAAGIKFESVIAANMAKLAKRFGPDYSYSNQKAQDRADKVPLDPLNLAADK